MEKNGVFSRVRSRFRSIFSKKSSCVKLRDYNGLLAIERIMSNPEAEVVGTIVAEATVDINELPNGAGITLTQETSFDREDFGARKLSSQQQQVIISTKSKRFRRLSSGDLNIIRRMTEEIEFDLTNIVFDGIQITSEVDVEGSEQTFFKPGPTNSKEQQMLFLKQCLDNVETRPPNINYITQRWTTHNFEGLLKYMMKSEDCVRPTFLRVELSDCIPSLNYVRDFLSEYSSFKNFNIEYEYVYATIHSKNISREQKLRGDIKPFLEIEDKVRKARISYLTHFVLTSQTTPNVTVLLRFYCLKPCLKKMSPIRNGVIVQLEQLTGHIHTPEFKENIKLDVIDCECEEGVPNTDDLIDLCDEQDQHDDNDQSYMTADQTDFNSTARLEINESREYLEMFPLLLDLFDRAGVCDLVDDKEFVNASQTIDCEEDHDDSVSTSSSSESASESTTSASTTSTSLSSSSAEEEDDDESEDEDDSEEEVCGKKKSPKKVCCF